MSVSLTSSIGSEHTSQGGPLGFLGGLLLVWLSGASNDSISNSLIDGGLGLGAEYTGAICCAMGAGDGGRWL